MLATFGWAANLPIVEDGTQSFALLCQLGQLWKLLLQLRQLLPLLRR